MEKCKFILIIIFLHGWLGNCSPRRKKIESVKKINKMTGESIAVDNLIQKYEKEHKKFYGEETENGFHFEWLVLNGKNLSNYCRKYLQHSVPTITTDNATGNRIRTQLYYEKENISNVSTVVIVHCKVKRKYTMSYYVTRAPEPNCVYSLKRPHIKAGYIFTIINKHCDFEDRPLKTSRQKRERLEITSHICSGTGQPIATDEYLQQYELEHQIMLEKEDKEGNYIEWVNAVKHPNLDSYCIQYMRECAPDRHREGTTGSWKTAKLNYQKLDTLKFIRVIIIICVSSIRSKRRYYVTRAPEPNCVYALRRHRNSLQNSLVIIFKHCDFEYGKDQQTIAHDHHIPNITIIPKTEVKEERFDKLETVQLFQND